MRYAVVTHGPQPYLPIRAPKPLIPPESFARILEGDWEVSDSWKSSKHVPSRYSRQRSLLEASFAAMFEGDWEGLPHLQGSSSVPSLPMPSLPIYEPKPSQPLESFQAILEGDWELSGHMPIRASEKLSCTNQLDLHINNLPNPMSATTDWSPTPQPRQSDLPSSLIYDIPGLDLDFLDDGFSVSDARVPRKSLLFPGEDDIILVAKVDHKADLARRVHSGEDARAGVEASRNEGRRGVKCLFSEPREQTPCVAKSISLSTTSTTHLSRRVKPPPPLDLVAVRRALEVEKQAGNVYWKSSESSEDEEEAGEKRERSCARAATAQSPQDGSSRECAISVSATPSPEVATPPPTVNAPVPSIAIHRRGSEAADGLFGQSIHDIAYSSFYACLDRLSQSRKPASKDTGNKKKGARAKKRRRTLKNEP